MMHTKVSRSFAAAAALALTLAACGGEADPETPETEVEQPAEDEPAEDEPAEDEEPADETAEDETAAPAGCTPDELALLEAGQLTVGTGDPVFPPWMLNDDPAGGEGFENGIVYALAEELGFAAEDVVWVSQTFDETIAPGPKDFDFNLQQFTITDERKQAVDFSDGYYAAPQAVFGLADSAAASATTIADLKGLKIGVAAGTTSVDYVESVIAPESDALIFNDNAAVKVALESNQIDAVVTDLPTALYITGVEIEGTKVFGQIEGSGGDEWGLLLAKDSTLTECVNLALAALTTSGELETITTTWMSEFTDAPLIKS